jgi:aspartyl/glutamyl-tRNA(Asn/Gln) amidotransferase C subunit
MRPARAKLQPRSKKALILTDLPAAGTIPLFANKEAHLSADQQPITPEIFEHLVQLAQFDLSEEQSEYLRQQLNDQLKSIRQLEAIEIGEEVDITSHGVPYGPDIRPGIRADRVEGSGLADAILEQGPDREDRYIVVPDIPHEELE